MMRKVSSFPPLHNQPRRVAPLVSLLARMRRNCPVTSGASRVPQGPGGSRHHRDCLGTSRQPASSALHDLQSPPAGNGITTAPLRSAEWHGEAPQSAPGRHGGTQRPDAFCFAECVVLYVTATCMNSAVLLCGAVALRVALAELGCAEALLGAPCCLRGDSEERPDILQRTPGRADVESALHSLGGVKASCGSC